MRAVHCGMPRARADAPHSINDFLRARGYDTPDGMRRARAVLEAAGLTNARKKAIAGYKLAAAEGALASALVRVCGGGCAALARAMSTERREPVVTSSATCEVCGGSNNRRAAIACAITLRRNRVRRLLVVGGSAPQQHELRSLLEGDGITLEFVDGTARSHSQRDAIANMRRADLVVVWGATPLRHAVSNLYTDAPLPGVRVITVPRRGIEALCGEIVRSYHASSREQR
jgi:hypothetical protein